MRLGLEFRAFRVRLRTRYSKDACTLWVSAPLGMGGLCCVTSRGYFELKLSERVHFVMSSV